MARRTTLVILSTLTFLIVGAGVLYVYAGSDPFVPTASQDMLPAIKAGLANSLSAIRGGKGRVISTDWHVKDVDSGSVLKTEATYLVVFSGEKFKVSLDRKIIQNDSEPNLDPKVTLLAPGFTDHRDASYNGQLLTTIDASAKTAYIRDSRTNASELNRYRLDTSIISPVLDDLLTALSSTGQPSVRIVGNELVDGDDCVVVEVASTGPTSTGGVHTATEQFWINTSKGFAISKVRIWEEGGLFKTKTLVSDMSVQLRDYGSGIWAPCQIWEAEYRINTATGKCYKQTESTVTFGPDFTLNGSIAPADLSLPIPSGTKVHDEVADMVYTQP